MLHRGSVREGIRDPRQDSMELPQTNRETLCFSWALLTVRVTHFLKLPLALRRLRPWLKTQLTSSSTITWPRS